MNGSRVWLKNDGEGSASPRAIIRENIASKLWICVVDEVVDGVLVADVDS